MMFVICLIALVLSHKMYKYVQENWRLDDSSLGCFERWFIFLPLNVIRALSFGYIVVSIILFIF